MEFTEKNLKARYDELCAKRDAVYASQKSLEADLAVFNAEAESARVKAAEIAAQIDAQWVEANWFALKKEIALIAKTLSRPNGPLAS